MPAGRPTKYRPEFCQGIIDFFSSHESLPLMASYAVSIGVSREAINQWSHKYPEFMDAIKIAKAIQEKNLVEGALSGKYHPTFAIFTAKNVLGWRDQRDVLVSDKRPAIEEGLEKWQQQLSRPRATKSSPRQAKHN